jgi:hypothetical protein
LDHGTIGDGIGKRDTQFNDIGPGLFYRHDKLFGLLQ